MEKYFSFSGTDTRSTYWAIILITWFAGTVAVIMSIAGIAIGAETDSYGLVILMSMVTLALSVALVWLVIATVVRRLRDAGQSPLWVLATFLPYVGFIAYIVFGCLPTEEAKEE